MFGGVYLNYGGNRWRVGSWMGGADGAQPGRIMLAHPLSGITYRQEYYNGEAEDRGTVLATGEPVTVSAGTYTDCVKTKDWVPLEPGVVEYKYYAPGIGFVLEESGDGSERIELVNITIT